MIPKEVLAQVRRIEIKTRRLVAETFGGQYLSVFKGQGIEFAEVREYVPGDDVRSIDRNVTARTGRPHLRQYQDERELTVLLACDLSGSQRFGSGAKLKQEVAAELCALIAFSALHNNDKVGLFIFTEGPELYIPPRKGRSHVLTMIRDLLAFRPERKGTAIGPSLDTLNRMIKRRCILFLVSDFQDAGFEKAFKRASFKHDLVPVVIEDPRESDLPALNAWLETEDPETGERASIWAGSGTARAELAERRAAWRRSLEQLFKTCGVEHVDIRADEPYADPLVRFFRTRSKRFR